MESKEESVKNGLKVYEKMEDLCISCHNAESPTYVDFKLDEYWAKIKHTIPENKN
jgi:hypothetical protein